MIRIGLIGALLPLLATAQQTGRVRAGEVPPTSLKGEVHGIADPAPLRSSDDPLKELCERADLIVEGVVESDAARLMPGRGGSVETDFWIAVDRVLKGAPETRKVVTSEMGGTFGELRLIMNYTLLKQPGLQPSQRYILFLNSDKSTIRPAIPGLDRYQDNVFYGRYFIEDGKVRATEQRFPVTQFNGMTVEAFEAQIIAHLK